jgi:prolyl oligopeptidase
MIRLLVIAAALALVAPNHLEAEQAIVYPPSKTVDVVDDYHGTPVADAYRWMEDLESADTKAWIEMENRLTFNFLDSLPLRRVLHKRITELWDYPKVTVPSREGGRLWYRRNSGLQRQAVVYSKANVDAAPVLVIDPNSLSPDGSLSLTQFAPSPDGKLLAYAVSEGGIDWETIRVRDLASRRDLADTINWVRYSRIAWTHDGKGFFYSRYPTPSSGMQFESPLGIHSLYYHRLGTPQSADRLFYERTDKPSWLVRGTVTQDGRYLIVRISQSIARRSQVFYMNLEDPKQPNLEPRLRPLVGTGEAVYRVLGNVETIFYVLTDANAPKRRVVAVDINESNLQATKTIIPEGPSVIQDAKLVGGKIVVQYLVNVQSQVKLFALDGHELGTLTAPGIGTIRDLAGRSDSAELFYNFTSPLNPSTVFVCQELCRSSTPFEAAKWPFDPEAYETKQFFAQSKDGTRVPYFLTGRKNLQRNGNNPTMLYGYGGFSTTIMPRYRPDVPAWLELGGIFVTTDIRGGGAFGEEWHRGGMLDKKQNSFDDFIAVAEDLIQRGFTSPAKLAIQGSSNGGLLIGAVINRRPDLFAAALPAAGVMDMLRYDKFTSGAEWVAEYGAPSDAKMFPFLFQYSPLHNLKPGVCYPATLVMTADRDDRVVPSHSFKYVAALQKAQDCKRPVLIRIEKGVSHSYRPTDRRIVEVADGWAFVAAQTGVTATAAVRPRAGGAKD